MSGFHRVQNRATGVLANTLAVGQEFLYLTPGHTLGTDTTRVWSIGDELIYIQWYDEAEDRFLIARGAYNTTPADYPPGTPVNEFVLAETIRDIQWVVQELMSALVSTNDGVPIVGDHEALQVIETDPPSLQARVRKGVALGSIMDERILVWNKTLHELPPITPPQSSPRIDLVQIRPAFGLEVVVGVEGGSPETPSPTEGAIPLAELHHRVGTSSIKEVDDSVNSYIVDVRAGL